MNPIYGLVFGIKSQADIIKEVCMGTCGKIIMGAIQTEAGEPTGRAGQGEDSIYCEECDEGPFCPKCWGRHPHNKEEDK